MRIAVACDGLNVAAQASGCASFTCYAVNHGIISGCCNVPNMGITIFESVDTFEKGLLFFLHKKWTCKY